MRSRSDPLNNVIFRIAPIHDPICHKPEYAGDTQTDRHSYDVAFGGAGSGKRGKGGSKITDILVQLHLDIFVVIGMCSKVARYQYFARTVGTSYVKKTIRNSAFVVN
jgi:hypothetical protein